MSLLHSADVTWPETEATADDELPVVHDRPPSFASVTFNNRIRHFSMDWTTKNEKSLFSITDLINIASFGNLSPSYNETRRALRLGGLSGAHVPPTKVFRRLTGSVNNTIVKPRVAAAANTYTSDFTDVKFCVAAIMIAEEAIRFRHLDCNPDRAQKLISLSMSRHLSTSNISSKSMHAFLSNLANRQTDRQTNAGNRTYLLLCRR